MMIGTDLFQPSLFTLSRPASGALDLAATDVVFKFCNLHVERIHFLLNFSQLCSLSFLVNIFVLGPFPFVALWRLGDAGDRKSGFELG